MARVKKSTNNKCWRACVEKGGQRCGLDPALPWLWCRSAATAPIGPLAWEPPHAASAALKNKTKQNKKQNTHTHTKKKKTQNVVHIHDGILLSHQKERSDPICSNMDGT